MALQLLAMGVIGVRLYDRILTAPARYPEELADQLVDEIHAYLPRASLEEKEILFLLVRDMHDVLARRFCEVSEPLARRQIAFLLGEMLQRARRLARHGAV
ncbi:hypothetical protein [Chitinilyticum litopenaei]|uniref:hypothetical protein n=1 Tax=Chitinilyticum litopenaei TaxID=1121276 RepID=UPI0004096224|nr:hypothetical protein [Chitinilyticum litopenaei]